MTNKYLLEEKLPHFWCAGCGNGIVLGSLVRAMEKLGLRREETVVVTGIGCWGKADDYLRTNTFHGTHGRALPFSTGIKLANPALRVVTLMGDGDGTTIGGNHLIHAARRNVDLTAIIVNNLNYGMTGGQYSGTTPKEARTKTSPYGHVEEGFDICALVQAAGAPFVARGTVFDVLQLDKLVERAMTHRGFALVEAVAPCPTHYGKNNGMPRAADMMRWIKENTLPVAKADKLEPGARRGKFVTGVFVDTQREDYSAAYQRMAAAAEGGDGR